MSYFTPAKYVKDESNDPFFSTKNNGFYLRSRILPAIIPIMAALVLTTQVLAPLVFFKTQDEVIKPLANSALGYMSGFSDFSFEELETSKTQRTNGTLGISTQAPQQVTQKDKVEEYFYLTVPKLNIENAKVEINEPTLQPDTALGHYTGSALPGEPGNSFIYGHSVLPFFYNPNNYKTIFSTIDKLEPGDEIYITFKNETFTYKVLGTRELKPTDVNPLGIIRPRFLNESTVVLMTCYPMGTRLNRLLVDAILVE